MIFTWYPNDFWHKRKIDHFDPYNNVLLATATNIPVLLMTGFAVQAHKYQTEVIFALQNEFNYDLQANELLMKM